MASQGNKKLWVPMPASKLYQAQGADPESLRDQMVRQFGSTTVQEAELSCILDLLMVMGVVKPSEFVDLMQKKLHRIDQRRRMMAQLDEDRG
jgi:hypothetical protein